MRAFALNRGGLVRLAAGETAGKRGVAAARFVRRINRWNVVPIALSIALVLGICDFLTGIDLAFTLLYLLPIGLATWFRGRLFAVGIALLCVSSTVLAELYTRLHFGWRIHPFTMTWNHGGTVGMLVVGIELLWHLHLYIEKEARERRMAVEQLRHAERLNLVGTLAAGVAHELGTPLNVILGSAEVIEGGDASAERTRQLAATIQKQAAKMTAIIHQLLDFSRKGGTEMEATDLGVLAKEGVYFLEPLARRHDAALVVEVPAERPIVVRANRVELGQVINNLIVNAIQSMPRGGTARVRCELRTEPGKDGERRASAALVVSDEGEGIAPDDLVRVFDPFFTTKDVGVGTGLGLSVTYGIVHDHSGTINVESRLGSGSRFTVLLPLA